MGQSLLRASVPVCSLALLLMPGKAGPLWASVDGVLSPLAGASDLGLRRPGSWWRALRRGCGLFGEGLKGFCNVVLCQIGKTLCPPLFSS